MVPAHVTDVTPLVLPLVVLVQVLACKVFASTWTVTESGSASGMKPVTCVGTMALLERLLQHTEQACQMNTATQYAAHELDQLYPCEQDQQLCMHVHRNTMVLTHVTCANRVEVVSILRRSVPGSHACISLSLQLPGVLLQA
jgi:hypothetical protein